jgi:hypothetical protein
MINTVINLISSEITPENVFANPTAFSGWHNRSDFQMSIVFSKSLIRLVGRYVNALKEQFNLEQVFGTNNVLGPNTPNGLVYLINFLIPLLFWGASNKKDSPKLNTDDLSFAVNMLLNSLKPPSKLAASLLLTAPKQHHLTSAFESNQSNNLNNKSHRHIKDLINQSAFLTLKILVYSFSKQLDLNKITTTIKQICVKAKTVYLWKFLEFITSNRTPIFLMLKPFIENYVIFAKTLQILHSLQKIK